MDYAVYRAVEAMLLRKRTQMKDIYRLIERFDDFTRNY